MRKNVFIFLMILGTTLSFAQTKGETKTVIQPNIVKMLTEHGHLHKKEYYSVYKEASYEHKVMIVTDAISNSKYGCLQIVTYKNDIGILELFEIDNFVKALTFIKDKVLNTTPTTETTYEYKSLHGVEISLWWNQDQWKCIISTSTRAAGYYLDGAIHIENIITSLQEAKALIVEKIK